MEVGIEVVVTLGLEHALRQFKRKVDNAGLMPEIKRRARFTSRTEVRRRRLRERKRKERKKSVPCRS